MKNNCIFQKIRQIPRRSCVHPAKKQARRTFIDAVLWEGYTTLMELTAMQSYPLHGRNEDDHGN